MNQTLRSSHARECSLTSLLKRTPTKSSTHLRRTHLSKFSTSDFDEQTYNQSQPHIQEIQVITTGSSNQNTVPSVIEHPYIDSKLINSIFPSDKIPNSKHRKTYSNKFFFPSKFHERDKVLNDYVVSKIKAIITKKQGTQFSILTKSKIQQYYTTFIETFSINGMKRIFQCLQTNKPINLSKQYIVNQLHAYYFNRNLQKSERKENDHDILAIKMNKNLIKNHELTILKTKSNIKDLLLQKKQVKRVSTLGSIQSQTTRFKVYENMIDRQVRQKNNELARETEKVKRLQITEDNLKKAMCTKVDFLLGSGQYSSNGITGLYNDFVENGLEERVFSVFLGPKQMDFMREKSSVERQINKLSQSCLNLKSHSKKKTQNEISKLKNELIVMEEDIVSKLKNDRHLEKNVYSLFGSGERGVEILQRVRLNNPLKKG